MKKREINRRKSKNRKIVRRVKAMKRAERKNDSRIVLKISAFLCIVIIMYFLVVKIGSAVNLPEIPVKEIKLEEIAHLDRARLLKKINVEKGDNLLIVNLKEVRKRLLSEPYVKDADVRRNFYSGLVTVKLKLREPAALLNCGGIYGVDEEGVLLWKIREADFCDFPLINGVRVRRIKPGEKINCRGMKRALEVLRYVSLSELESIMPVSEINVRDSRNVVLCVGKEGTRIRLGHDKLSEKINEAVKILAGIKSKGEEAEYIDFRFEFPGRAFVKLRRKGN